MRPPAARIRTQVEVPLRFADGYAADARECSFETKARKGRHTLELPTRTIAARVSGRTR